MGDSPRSKGRPLDTSWHERYLAAYRKLRTQVGAAAEAGVTVSTVKDHVRRFPELAAGISEIAREPLESSWAPAAETLAEANEASGEAETAEANDSDWAPRFLEGLRLCGSTRTAARLAGIPWGELMKRTQTDPELAAQIEEAKEGHLDDLEADLTSLGRKGNPIALIARLRADRPGRYLDKAQVQQVLNINSGGAAPSPEAIETLLREMIASARPATLEALAVKPNLSLPAPADPQ